MDELRQRTLGAIVKNAVLNPLSALVIAAGIVLVGINPQLPIPSQILDWSRWYWLVPIVPTWLGIVGAQLFSKRAGAEVVSQMFRAQFDVSQITNPNLRAQIAQAIAYRERIDDTIKRFGDTASRSRVQDVANQIEEWIRRIYSLATKLDRFHNDTVLTNDRTAVPDAIRKLRQRAAMEGDPGIKQEIANTIAQRQAQLDNINNLAGTMERAELQLENTLTALGTVYSQVLMVDASDVNSGKTQRLRENILEQVNGLQDLLSSMDEVYGGENGSPLQRASGNLGK